MIDLPFSAYITNNSQGIFAGYNVFAPTFCVNTGFSVSSSFPNSNINIFCPNNFRLTEFSMPSNFNLSLFSFNPSQNFLNFDFRQNLFNFNNAFTNYTIANNPSSSSSSSKVAYIHWSKMDDAKMREFFGDYDFDVTQKYNGTADDLNKFLDKYSNSELKGKGQAFIDAQNKYNISALALLAICGAETSYGTDGEAVKRHNFANIEKEKNASYDGRWRKFDSAEDCIMELARLLRENYVDSPGSGKVAHLSKLYQIGPKFCPAKEDGTGAGWAKLVHDCMNDINKTISA